MPHTCRSQYSAGPAPSGGERPFAKLLILRRLSTLHIVGPASSRRKPQESATVH
jgi:hypothetical protein